MSLPGRLTLGGILLGAVIGTAVLAPALRLRDPIRQDLNVPLFSPSRYYPLGTDQLGRDVMSRMAWGARVSLTVATLATVLAALVGSAVGLAAGAAGGRIERFLMRLVDLALAFPTLALLLVLAALFRSDSVAALVLLLGLTTWMPIARLVRAEAASLSQRPFMEAAAGLGASRARRALRHLAPNVASTIIVAATLQVGEVMLMESGLSYLGLGVAAPTPSWGDMVRQGMQDLSGAWWVATFPGIALCAAVIGFNLVGDGLRDAMDPRLPVTAAAAPPDPPRWHPEPAPRSTS